MCTVLLSPGVNPIAIDKYIILLLDTKKLKCTIHIPRRLEEEYEQSNEEDMRVHETRIKKGTEKIIQ